MPPTGVFSELGHREYVPHVRCVLVGAFLAAFFFFSDICWLVLFGQLEVA